MTKINNITKRFLVILFSVILCFCFAGCKEKTQEEIAESQMEMEQDKIATTHSYEVIDVFQCVKRKTNGYGGIRSTKIVTGFSYIDDNGKIQIYDDWYGDIIISDENKYVYCDSSYYENRFRALYVTKDMMAKIQIMDN